MQRDLMDAIMDITTNIKALAVVCEMRVHAAAHGTVASAAGHDVGRLQPDPLSPGTVRPDLCHADVAVLSC